MTGVRAMRSTTGHVCIRKKSSPRCPKEMYKKNVRTKKKERVSERKQKRYSALARLHTSVPGGYQQTAEKEKRKEEKRFLCVPLN